MNLFLAAGRGSFRRSCTSSGLALSQGIRLFDLTVPGRSRSSGGIPPLKFQIYFLPGPSAHPTPHVIRSSFVRPFIYILKAGGKNLWLSVGARVGAWKRRKCGKRAGMKGTRRKGPGLTKIGSSASATPRGDSSRLSKLRVGVRTTGLGDADEGTRPFTHIQYSDCIGSVPTIRDVCLCDCCTDFWRNSTHIKFMFAPYSN